MADFDPLSYESHQAKYARMNHTGLDHSLNTNYRIPSATILNDILRVHWDSMLEIKSLQIRSIAQ